MILLRRKSFSLMKDEARGEWARMMRDTYRGGPHLRRQGSEGVSQTSYFQRPPAPFGTESSKIRSGAQRRRGLNFLIAWSPVAAPSALHRLFTRCAAPFGCILPFARMGDSSCAPRSPAELAACAAGIDPLTAAGLLQPDEAGKRRDALKAEASAWLLSLELRRGSVGEGKSVARVQPSSAKPAAATNLAACRRGKYACNHIQRLPN